jgi:hypothetical protein
VAALAAIASTWSLSIPGRGIRGAFAEYEKARLVAKLKAARDRKRAQGNKCGDRKATACAAHRHDGSRARLFMTAQSAGPVIHAQPLLNRTRLLPDMQT